VSNVQDVQFLRRSVSGVVVSHRLSSAGIDPARIKDLTRELELRTVRLSEAGEREDRGAAIILAFILLMILYMAIIMWGQVVMTGVIEEKGSRVVEVVLSGLSATELLGGKLIGIGAAGLTQFTVWTISLLGVSFAAGSNAAPSMFTMPEISPFVLVSFVLFFILGFAFYASLYAAVGAAVNNLQEAQNFVLPLVMPLVVAIMLMMAILESPDGPLAVVVSLIPPLAPLLMFLRIVVLTPPLWQIALSLGLLLASIVGVIWFAARIYRVGVLMYGKRPTFPELLRWVRHS
jgi:ABC-2 type transport system permease protein